MGESCNQPHHGVADLSVKGCFMGSFGPCFIVYSSIDQGVFIGHNTKVVCRDVRLVHAG